LLATLGLDATAYLLVLGAAFIGALVQGSIGFGLNLIVAPVVAVHRPEALPAAAILLALPMTAGSALRERTHIDWAAVNWTTLGRLPGVVGGAWLVATLDAETLAMIIGLCVLAGVGMSLASPSFRIDRRSQAIAGLVGGLMGTASSIGGPPMALLYQHEPGPVIRSTLGATFMVGTVLSLLALALAGEVREFHVVFAGATAPAVLAGLFASRFLHDSLDAGWLRPCVLGFAALAAVAVLVRGLWMIG
jgi:uncharacterized membrane protein YfcA